MTTVLLLLVIAIGVTLLVRRGRRHLHTSRSAARLAGSDGLGTYDHDRERQLAELRGMRGYREDPPLLG